MTTTDEITKLLAYIFAPFCWCFVLMLLLWLPTHFWRKTLFLFVFCLFSKKTSRCVCALKPPPFSVFFVLWFFVKTTFVFWFYFFMMWPVIKWKSHLLTFLHISLKKEKETITDILQNNNVLLWLRKKNRQLTKNSIYQIGWSFDRFPLLLFTMQLFCDPTLLKTTTITKKFSYYRIRPQIVSDKYPSNPPSSFLATPSIDVRSPALNQNEFLKSNYFYNTPNAFCLDYFSLWNP